MATNKELIEQLISQQKEQAEKQLEVALKTSDRLNKLEMFIYGDPLTETKGVIQELRQTKDDVEYLKSMFKLTKGKFLAATSVIGFVATGVWAAFKIIGSYFFKS